MPSCLYKYEPFTQQSLENLKAQSIYFGSPSGFNDPYDCAFLPHIRTPSDAEVESIREVYLHDPATPELARKQFEVSSTEQLREIFLREGRSVLDHAVQEFLTKRGVSCFSERNDDLLMWSHYGGRHKGFCLEFDTSHTPFEKIMKVKYSQTLPVVDIAPLLASDNYEQVLELFTTKAEAWRYECEWRAVHAEAGTLYTYSAESLTGVYFGSEISDQALEIVCLILQGQNEGVRFWRGRRNPTIFKVDFEPFTYTSYLRAKSMGLRD